MAIYLIFENEIHDQDAYDRYKAAVRPMVEAAGGQYLTRDGKVEVLAGNWHPKRVVIFKWPDQQTMEAFMASPEYAPWKKLREGASTLLSMVRVEGEPET